MSEIRDPDHGLTVLPQLGTHALVWIPPLHTIQYNLLITNNQIILSYDESLYVTVVLQRCS